MSEDDPIVLYPHYAGQDGQPLSVWIHGGATRSSAGDWTMASFGVDPATLKNMAAKLGSSHEQLEICLRFETTQHHLLESQHSLRVQTLTAALPQSQAELDRHQANYSHYLSHRQDFLAQLGVVQRRCIFLQEKLLTASGLYENTESQVAAKFSHFFTFRKEAWVDVFEVLGLGSVARLALDRSEFPEEFTIDGETYYSRDFNDVQLLSIVLSWIMQRLGEKVYGLDEGVRLYTEDGTVDITTSGFGDSPELEAYLAPLVDLEEIDPGQIAKAAFTVAPEAITWGGLFGPLGVPITWAGMTILKSGVWTMKADNMYLTAFPKEQAAREKSCRNFHRSTTGKALGATPASSGCRTSPQGTAAERNRRLRTQSLRTETYRGVHSPGVAQPGGRYFPRSVSEVIDSTDALDPIDGGAFEIQQWTTKEGKEGVRVLLRGTEAWDAGSVQVQDMLTNTEEVAGWESGQRKAVRQALMKLGVKSDTPVELFGHSQAGIVAANLAADPTFTSQFNVKTVITAGSPVAGARIPESIHTLHLENTYDLVPKLDGRLNFDSENHLTIEIDHGTPAPGENLGNWVFRNHDRMKTYLKDMQYLEELEPRKLENFLKCRDNALGLDREIASATATRFETQRY